MPPCTLTAGKNRVAGILLDFGTELQGTVELFTPLTEDAHLPVPMRIRFGESVSKAMPEIGGSQHADNNHAIRDQTV